MTITDVAKKAGVSKATVSRYLNQSGYVGEDTKRRIEAVIENCRYMPMAAARNLSKRESDTIGVLIPEITNPYFAIAFEGIGEMADQNGLDVFFYNTAQDPAREEKALYSLKKQGAKGVIIAPSVDFDNRESTRRFELLIQEIGLPMVFMDVSIDLDLGDGVFVDNQWAAYRAVEAMIERGYHNIGFLGTRRIKSIKDRFRGYCRALEAHGLSVQERFLVDAEVGTMEPSYVASKTFLEKGDLPEAMFTSNTFTSMGFLKAAFELGLVLEKDISCMAFDRLDFIEMFDLKYNYLERAPKSMGRSAVQLLLDRIEKPDMPVTRQLIPYRVVMYQNNS